MHNAWRRQLVLGGSGALAGAGASKAETDEPPGSAGPAIIAISRGLCTDGPDMRLAVVAPVVDPVVRGRGEPARGRERVPRRPRAAQEPLARVSDEPSGSPGMPLSPPSGRAHSHGLGPVHDELGSISAATESPSMVSWITSTGMLAAPSSQQHGSVIRSVATEALNSTARL